MLIRVVGTQIYIRLSGSSKRKQRVRIHTNYGKVYAYTNPALVTTILRVSGDEYSLKLE